MSQQKKWILFRSIKMDNKQELEIQQEAVKKVYYYLGKHFYDKELLELLRNYLIEEFNVEVE